MNKIKLNNGVSMPIVGLGTFPLKRFELIKVVNYATKLGYSLFDTSAAYQNESWLGRAILVQRCLRGKQQSFITTKLSNTDQRKGDARKALLKSTKRLKVKKVDLYLMHWPNPGTYLKMWKQMEELYHEGLVGAIGVCNFHIHHLEELFKIATVIPAVNQIELHPLLSQLELRNYCKDKGIQVEAYSPVARMNPKLIEHNILKEIAVKHNKTVPQIIIRWNIQHEIVVIPKSSNYHRLKENINVFDFNLSNSEMDLIDSINEDFRVRHNPDTADFNKL